LTGLRAKDVVLAQQARADLDALGRRRGKEAASIARRAHVLREVLLADCLHGEVVRKARIPPALAMEFGLQNLYVEDLPSFWRLLYTVVKDDGARYVVVLRIVDHATHSGWLPGRNA